MRNPINQTEMNSQLEALNELLTNEDKIKIQKVTMEYIEKSNKIMAKEGINEAQIAAEQAREESKLFNKIKEVLIDSKNKDKILSKFNAVMDAVVAIICFALFLTLFPALIASFVAVAMVHPILMLPAAPLLLAIFTSVASLVAQGVRQDNYQSKEEYEQEQSDLDTQIDNGKRAYTQLYSFFNSEKASTAKEHVHELDDVYVQNQATVH
ncbi:hypothetical protein [Legionella bononiensis]|uniref:DUF5638 domain-containing protein n=2 Tax=Legionella bononiensis TaxID=2793102 RepID=A0ABS1WFA3_9GAMM|nr:hypothetical protein [Legionella bononiensis]MBL7479247.1 hypothetical protein [Legionella bononiensis]MBL7528026.1 hypothetical protein [Legionella bononiensis]MBL7563897.1 hypothetical protein [Legionella bononiensis]